MYKYFIIYSFLCLILCYNSVLAQEISVSAKLEQKQITIGDQIDLTLNCKYPINGNITCPELNDTLTQEIEIIKKGTIDTLSIDKENIELSQKITITSFDSGYYKIPPICFSFNFDNDTNIYNACSDTLLLVVQSIDVDTNKVIKDITKPYEEPISLKELLPWIVGGIVLVAIIILLIYYFKRKKQNKPLFANAKKHISPHIIALQELDRIKKEKIWKQEKIKQYYTELTDTLRIYISKRYNINAMEMTSEEIIENFSNKIKRPENVELKNIDNLLKLADMVKFAKIKPLPSDNDKCLNDAYLFVNNTKEIENEELKIENK